MKKGIISILFVVISLYTYAQSHIGFLTDNYKGVHGVISNPASIMGSPLKLDVNLVGASVFGSNDYFGINILDATKDDYNFDLESKKHPLDDNRASLNIDILGPSVMFNLSDKSAIALFTRVRSFANINKTDGATITSIDDDATNDYNISEEDFNASAHAWSELGVSYSRVILDNNEHVLKLGASLKYLQGRASAYSLGKNIDLVYDEDGTDLGGGETTGSITTSGNLTFARFAEFDDEDYDYKKPNKANGLGADFGVIYEWKPNVLKSKSTDSIGGANTYKTSNYKLKLGLSITDIGYIDYKEGVKETFDVVNADVSEEAFDDASNIGVFLNAFYNQTSTGVGYIIDLPAALHFNVDYNFNDKIYLNLNTDFSLISKDRITASRITNIVSLTPRYETKWFSFYVPLSVVEKNGFRLGAGLRAGPLYVGSGSVISAFTGNDNRGADVYAGLKIPIYKSKKRIKDKDNDGILDKLDGCPKIPGPIENDGCPWGDKDNDSVPDNEDKCPEETGDKDNEGCPWGDFDGDGVPDNEDKCKYNSGTLANMGCPEAEVTEEVQKVLNDYAKVILFNSGVSSIKAESNKFLDEIVKILKESPSAKFTIEGHTDSIGSYESNQKLSEERAEAVKQFLVEKGIEPNRLEALGYGERKPIATNMYKAGRSQNRRVEINLVK